MDYINPHYFAAILDGLSHRFVLVIESEAVITSDGDFCPPRFAVGAINALRDPRYSSVKQLMEVGVTESPLHIPPNWLMAHQYIYIIHENTDEFGWQYRSQWPPYGPPGPKDEQWIKEMRPSSNVRRRIWMTTIVPRTDLIRVKRLLSDNIRVDHGTIKLQGELFRYEKGTLTKTWQRRKVVLHHDRIEFYSNNNKKGEVSLQECEVRMLFDNQCPGKQNAFSIRNSSGSVGLLLEADDKDSRRQWVLAIQYQMAINSPELNYVPMEYAPPTGGYPDNRVCVCGDLKMKDKDGKAIPRHFQLLPREVVYYEDDQLKGRIFVEDANIVAEDRSLNFSVSSASGITFDLTADSPEAKSLWMMGVRKQVQTIDNHTTMLKTMPKEETEDPACTPVERISQFYDANWTAPAVEGEDEDYLDNVFKAPYRNNPSHFEFSEELGINLDPALQPKEPEPLPVPEPEPEPVKAPEPEPLPEVKPVRTLQTMKSTKSFLNVFQPQVKLLDPKRALVNPRFMLSALKGVTHRFVLVLECENRKNAPKAIYEAAPPRFTVGGLRASKDPRTVPMNQLIRISNKNPEVQLPAGWFTLHPYIYITQQNTDDDGWQYRSTWSNGAVSPKDEQWVDVCEEDKMVRRRLWMVTVVKRDDLLRAKDMAYKELNNVQQNEAILQETLHMYIAEQTAGSAETWQRRKVLLLHDKLEFYQGNDKKGEVALMDCEVNLLVGKDSMDKEYAFAITHPSGSIKVILDADSRDMRLRWVKAITYQLAVISPDLNFDPFIFGPPSGELAEQRVLLGSSLEVMNVDSLWEEYQFHLVDCALQCYSREVLCGRLLLEAAVVRAGEGDKEFTIKAAGTTVRFRAKTEDDKYFWMRALIRQVQVIDHQKAKKVSQNNGIGDSNKNMSSRDRSRYFYDPEWAAQENEYREDDDFLKLLREKYEGNLKQFWLQSSPAGSPVKTSGKAPLRSSSSDSTVEPRMGSDNASISTYSGATSTTIQYGASGGIAARAMSQQSLTSKSQMSTLTSSSRNSLASRSLPDIDEYDIRQAYKDQVAKSAMESSNLYYLQFPNRSSLKFPSELVHDSAESDEAVTIGSPVSSPPASGSAKEEPQLPVATSMSPTPLKGEKLQLSTIKESLRPISLGSSSSSDHNDWLSSDDEDETVTGTHQQNLTPLGESVGFSSSPRAAAQKSSFGFSQAGAGAGQMQMGQEEVSVEPPVERVNSEINRFDEPCLFTPEAAAAPPAAGPVRITAFSSDDAVEQAKQYIVAEPEEEEEEEEEDVQVVVAKVAKPEVRSETALVAAGHSEASTASAASRLFLAAEQEEVHEHTSSSSTQAAEASSATSSASMRTSLRSVVKTVQVTSSTRVSMSSSTASFTSSSSTVKQPHQIQSIHQIQAASHAETASSASTTAPVSPLAAASKAPEDSATPTVSPTSRGIPMSKRLQEEQEAAAASSAVNWTPPVRGLDRRNSFQLYKEEQDAIPQTPGPGFVLPARDTTGKNSLQMYEEQLEASQNQDSDAPGYIGARPQPGGKNSLQTYLEQQEAADSSASSRGPQRKSSFIASQPQSQPLPESSEEAALRREQLRKTGFLELDNTRNSKKLTEAEQAALVHVHERGRHLTGTESSLTPLQRVRLRSVTGKDSFSLPSPDSSNRGMKIQTDLLPVDRTSDEQGPEAPTTLSPFKGIKLRPVQRDVSTSKEAQVNQEEEEEKPPAFLKMVKLRSVSQARIEPLLPSPSQQQTGSRDENDDAGLVKGKIRKFERPSLASTRPGGGRSASFIKHDLMAQDDDAEDGRA